jgi:hypothetical protein
MSRDWLKISIIIFFSAAFISGYTVILGIIAAYNDEPTPLVITVESDPPGADVYLNDSKLGTAPLSITIEGLRKYTRSYS